MIPAHMLSDVDFLKESLSLLQKLSSRSDDNLKAKQSLMEESLENFIKSSLAKGRNRTDVEAQMSSLCYEDIVVPTFLREWSFKRIKELYDNQDKTQLSVATLPAADLVVEKAPAIQSPFNKNAVYHSMLLCDVVTSHDENDYENFLIKQNTGHSFQELSYSISDRELSEADLFSKCIVAKSKNKLYVAFRGELSLSKWHQKFSAFESGEALH